MNAVLRTSASLGALLALRQIRGRAVLLIAALSVGFSALCAQAERLAHSPDAASVTLQGPAFGLALPLATLSLVALSLQHTRLDQAVGSIALLGASRRAAALGAMLATALVSAALGGLIGATGALVAHHAMSPSALLDGLTSARVGALTAFCYVFFYSFASSYGRRGGGRFFALLLDLVLGPTAGAIAVVLPRAHGLNLLGAQPVLGLSQAASSAALVGLACVFALLGCGRIRA